MPSYVLLPANHALFQLANIFLFFSYLSTNILFLRIVLALASLCFALWGALILAVAVDTVVWNSVFFIINTVQAIIIIYTMIPIRMSRPELEDIYQHWFEGPTREGELSRHQFKRIADAAEIIHLGTNTDYASPGTYANHLSLLYKGEMMVIQHRMDYTTHVLTSLSTYAFIDSPEWIARSSERGSRFEITMRTLVPCTIVRWKYEDIDRLLNKDDGTFRNVLASLIGQDLARKVFASNRSIWRFPRTRSPHKQRKSHSHIELTPCAPDKEHSATESFYESKQESSRPPPPPLVTPPLIAPHPTHYCTFLISPLTADLVKDARIT